LINHNRFTPADVLTRFALVKRMTALTKAPEAKPVILN